MALFKRRLRELSDNVADALRQILEHISSMQDDIEQSDRESMKRIEDLERLNESLSARIAKLEEGGTTSG